MMLDNLAASDNEIRKTFAEKAKNMVGLIGQNLQNHSGNIELVGIDANNTVKVGLPNT